MVSSDDPSTYLLIVTIGFVLTVAVGIILMKYGRGFLREVFGDADIAESVTKLLGAAFYLIALGFLAAVSTWDPFEFANTAQLVVTKIGGILLVLGILHIGTMLGLARVRNNRRVQSLAASLRSGRRPPEDGERTKALGT